MTDYEKRPNEKKAPSLELIYAINAVATALQKSIQSEENIYTVFQKQVVSLGLRGGISLYNERDDTLEFKTVAYKNPMRKVLSQFEKNLNLRAQGFIVPVKKVDIYQKVIHAEQSIFIEDTSTVSAQVVPDNLKGLVGPLLSFLGRPPGIFTPLIFDGKVMGMLNMVGVNLTKQDVPTMQAFANQIAVALENAKLLRRLQSAKDELQTAYQKTLEGWVQALDMRDHETTGHTLRTADLTVRLARYMGIPDKDIPHIHRGALLHDIGKMAVPDSILRKTAPLSEAEWEIMKQHPETAQKLLLQIKYLEPALDIPYSHQERWNGQGYPRGLKQEEIPFYARIFAVVDVWDAMSSDRPYRKAIPETEVIDYIRAEAGNLFDPSVVESFLQFLSEYPDLGNNR